MEFLNLTKINGYHAHIYFDATSFSLAESICTEAAKLFLIKMGRMHRKPIGPHPIWSCQLAFSRNEHTDLLSWLALNRNNLSILIHPLTGDDLKDHTDYAAWMGTPQKLNLNALKPHSEKQMRNGQN